MSENTNENENASRATDAKLHELLTGEKAFEHDGVWGKHMSVWSTSAHAVAEMRPLPHYTTNLNDIAKAELALAPALRSLYLAELNKINGPDTTWWEMFTATAAQRAQALVAVLERVRGEVGQ
jgi:hypothetical protein